jgi:hypothetical protein
MNSGKVSREGADNKVVEMRSYIFPSVNVVDSILVTKKKKIGILTKLSSCILRDGGDK